MAVEFLALLQHLNLSKGELEMADNYFTILRNDFPEVWIDQGIELGGGQPFTVGSEGEQRNRHHIVCRLSLENIRYLTINQEQSLPTTTTDHIASRECRPEKLFVCEIRRAKY